MPGTVARPETPSLVVRLRPAIELDDRQFFELCRINRDLRIERTAQGELEIMPPAGGTTSDRNAILTTLLTTWSLRDRTGRSFDSSGGFRLPNGAVRSPDASWVRSSRLVALTSQQREQFPPLCPDFVVELRSPSDSIGELQAKMWEYMENGACLGWLLDPTERRVYVYRPGAEVEVLNDPSQVSAEPELPGFSLDLSAIWGAES